MDLLYNSWNANICFASDKAIEQYAKGFNGKESIRIADLIYVPSFLLYRVYKRALTH